MSFDSTNPARAAADPIATVASNAPIHRQWAAMTGEALTASVTRRYVTGGRLTVAQLELKRGGLVPRHSHDNEQVSCVLSGALQFDFDGRQQIVRAGEVLVIPGGVPHEVLVLEDTIAIDVFSPVRQDWIDGTDTYFAGGVRD